MRLHHVMVAPGEDRAPTLESLASAGIEIDTDAADPWQAMADAPRGSAVFLWPDLIRTRPKLLARFLGKLAVTSELVVLSLLREWHLPRWCLTKLDMMIPSTPELVPLRGHPAGMRCIYVPPHLVEAAKRAEPGQDWEAWLAQESPEVLTAWPTPVRHLVPLIEIGDKRAMAHQRAFFGRVVW